MGLGAGGNYVWCLVIVVIFMEFGRAKKWEDVLKSSLGVARQATKGGRGGGGVGSFHGDGRFLLCDNVILKLYCKSY